MKRLLEEGQSGDKALDRLAALVATLGEPPPPVGARVRVRRAVDRRVARPARGPRSMAAALLLAGGVAAAAVSLAVRGRPPGAPAAPHPSSPPATPRPPGAPTGSWTDAPPARTPAARAAPTPAVPAAPPPRPTTMVRAAPGRPRTGGAPGALPQGGASPPSAAAAGAPACARGEALVAAATRALTRDHDAGRALVLLDDYLDCQPDGLLVEEASVRAIEAASLLDPMEARARAATYLARFPEGHFRRRVERLRSALTEPR